MDDRIAPRAVTQLLAWTARQPWGAAFRSTLPVAGVDGTLTNRFRNSPLKGKLWAKTANVLNETVALTGFLTAASGKTCVFGDGEWTSAGEQCGERGGGAHLRGDRSVGVRLKSETRHPGRREGRKTEADPSTRSLASCGAPDVRVLRMTL